MSLTVDDNATRVSTSSHRTSNEPLAPRRRSSNQASRADARVPIACRLVPTDQWLRTHLDMKWTVRCAKIFLLARCADASTPFPFALGTVDTTPSLLQTPSLHIPSVPHTPVSPSQPSTCQSSASVASSRSATPSSRKSTRDQAMETESEDSASSGEVVFALDPHQELDMDDDDVPALRPAHRLRNRKHSKRARSGTIGPTTGINSSYKPTSPTSPQKSLAGSSTLPFPPQPFSISSLFTGQSDHAKLDDYFNKRGSELGADQYYLCSFSTGQTLEDHIPMSYYRFRPGEMLEIQRKATRVHLPRATYTQPYFDMPVCVRLAKEKDKDHNQAERDRELEWLLQNNAARLAASPDSTGDMSSPHSIFSTHLPRDQQPHRSKSTHFKYDVNSFEQDRDGKDHKGKGKERTRDPSTNEQNPGSADMAHSGASLAGLGYPYSRREDDDVRERRAAKERKEQEKYARKTKEWKTRWLVIKDGVLYLWKDRSLDAVPAKVFSLDNLTSIREISVPSNVMALMPNMFTTSLVSVTFNLPQPKVQESGRHARSGYIVTMQIRLRDLATHDHFLRVLYRQFLTSLPTTSPTEPTPEPPSNSLAWQRLTRLIDGAAISPARRSISRSSFRSTSSHSRSRSPSPVSRIHLPHRHLHSLSRAQSTPSLAESIARSSRSRSRDGDRHTRHPPPPPSRLHASSKKEKIRVLPGASSGAQRHLAEPNDTASDREPPTFLSPAVPGHIPSPTKRMSASFPPPKRHPSASFPEPPLNYLPWRETLIKTGSIAGRGEAFLRPLGGELTAWGQWQYDDDDDGGAFIINEETMPLLSSGQRTKLSKQVSGDALSADEHSEYEWESWKSDAGYNRNAPITRRHPVRPRADDVSESVASTSAAGSPTSQMIDTGSRKGSVPTVLTISTGPQGGITPDALSPKTPTTATTLLASFADVVVGRARSKSVATITPQRWQQPTQPHPPLPASATSLFFKKPPPSSNLTASASRPAIEPLKDKGAAAGKGKRLRSSTVSASSNRTNAPPRRQAQEPPPSAIRGVPLTRTRSNQSDISLNSALNLAYPVKSSNNSSRTSFHSVTTARGRGQVSEAASSSRSSMVRNGAQPTSAATTPGSRPERKSRPTSVEFTTGIDGRPVRKTPPQTSRFADKSNGMPDGGSNIIHE